MKTRKMWFVMAAAAVLTGMMMTSCDKDDEIFPKEVIESEVLDQGIDEQVEEQVGTDGTQLSYESWIVVKGITRAAFENKVSVTLNNTLNNVNKEIEVSSWESGDATISVTCKAGESRKNGDFVTVLDSIMVCRVQYPNFSFDYELVYQVGLYDDGVTKQTMPHHKYENIVNNGCELSELDDVTENGKAYKRQRCAHSITVTFNGKQYTVSSELVLKKEVKGEDMLLSSKVVDEGVSFSETDSWSGELVSWIMLEQTWSESGIKQIKKEVVLKNDMLETTGFSTNELATMPGPNDFVIKQENADPGRLEKREADGFTIQQYGYNVTVRLNEKASGKTLVYMPYEFVYEKATYQDEKLTYEMPFRHYENPQSSFTAESWNLGEGGMYSMKLGISFSIQFGEKTYSDSERYTFFYGEQR